MQAGDEHKSSVASLIHFAIPNGRCLTVSLDLANSQPHAKAERGKHVQVRNIAYLNMLAH